MNISNWLGATYWLTTINDLVHAFILHTLHNSGFATVSNTAQVRVHCTTTGYLPPNPPKNGYFRAERVVCVIRQLVTKP